MIVNIPTGDEDAPPAVGGHSLAICDGMGSASHIVEVGGIQRTQAYFASRVVMDCVARHLEENHEAIMSAFDMDLPSEVLKLKSAILADLTRFSEENGIRLENLGTRGGSTRLLPTTLASCVWREEDDHVDVVCLWAGDSRCYSMSPSEGLRLLTEDDSATAGDAMADLLADSPMSNFVSLSHSFHINWRTFRIAKPCMLFAASDGCFAYLSSPMEMELLIVPEDGTESPSEHMTRLLEPRAFDDRTLAGRAFGFDESDAHEVFADRRRHMASVLRPAFEAVDEWNAARSERSRIRRLEPTDENLQALKEAKARVNELERSKNALISGIWDESFRDSFGAVPLSCGIEAEIVDVEPVDPEDTVIEKEKDTHVVPTVPVEPPVEPIDPIKPVEPLEVHFPVDPVTPVNPVAVERLKECKNIGRHIAFGEWVIDSPYAHIRVKRNKTDKFFVVFARESESTDDYMRKHLKRDLRKNGIMCVDNHLQVIIDRGFTFIRYSIHDDSVPIGALGATDAPSVKQMAYDLARTVKSFHTKGWFHNGIYPGNVVVYGRGSKYNCVLNGWHSAVHMDESSDPDGTVRAASAARDVRGLGSVIEAFASATRDPDLLRLAVDIARGRITDMGTIKDELNGMRE